MSTNRGTLAALFLGTFVMGCGEMLVVGLLNLIAGDLRVSVPAAGGLVGVSALGLAIGGPLLTALTVRLDKRRLLVGALAVFVVATLVPLLVPAYGPFLVARFVSGATQGLFIAAACTVSTKIVPPERAGRALSMVLSGFAVSTALGVPLGTLLGQALGWRGAFLAVLACAVVPLAALPAMLPPVPSTGGSRLAGQARYAFAPQVLAVLGLAFLMFAGSAATQTYIVPFLRQVTGVPAAATSVFLMAYGLATAVGSFVGGRFADRGAARTLIVGTTGTALALLALYLVGASPVLVAVVVLVWGCCGFGIVPSYQYRVVSLAGPGGELASSLPASVANAGVAVGSAAGGLTFGTFGVGAVALTGTVLAALSVAAAWACRGLKPPAAPSTAPEIETHQPVAA
jgi:DHA1 family inner membrane transport protein